MSAKPKTTRKKQTSERSTRPLTFDWFKRNDSKSSKPTSNKRSIKAHSFSLTSRTRIVFKFNSVRTPKSKRAKYYRQIILPLYGLKSKEFNIYLQEQKVTGGPVLYLQNQNSSALASASLVVIGIVGLIYFLPSSGESSRIEPEVTYSSPAPSLGTNTVKEKESGLPASKPTKISVKNAGINAPVKVVGQNRDETLEVPPLFENITGWYKYGPTPGEVGPAVIVGHVDTHKGPSVFYNLKNLKKGDVINVSREDGSDVKFKVYGLEQFERAKFPTEKVYGNTDDAELRLITCGGTFNKQTLKYSENTVVFASII